MRQRLDYLDNLRTALTCLVVIFHTAIAYGASGSWIYVDVDNSSFTLTSIVLTLFTAICQAFFMGLFFFLSAYFMPASLDRKGTKKFLGDRTLRLGLPLIAYCFVIGPITVWYAQCRGTISLTQFYSDEVWSFRQIFFGPAWFIEALLYFTILYAICRLVFNKQNSSAQTRLFPSLQGLLLIATATGFIAFIVRLGFPAGEGPLGLQLGYFPAYILFFIAGLTAYRNNWLSSISRQRIKAWRWITAGVIPILPVGLILTGALDGNLQFAGGLNIQALLYAFWEPFVGLGISLLLLYLFQQHFNSASPLRKWLSAHAYTVYLIHPAVVVFWTIAFHRLHWFPAVKWAIVSCLSLILCFLISGLLRLIPGVRRVL